MGGDQPIPLALVPLDVAGQTAALGRHLRELRSHVGERQALGFEIGEHLQMPHAHDVAFLLQFLGATCFTALVRGRLIQLRAQLGDCVT